MTRPGSLVRRAARRLAARLCAWCWPLGLAAAAFGAMAAPEPAWPWARVALPTDLRTFDMGQGVGINGVPLSMRGFVAGERPAQMVSRFRQSLGEPLVVDRLKGRTILGRMVRSESGASHYLTVQIEAAPGGSRGVIALSDLSRASDSFAQGPSVQARWQDRLPAGSQVLNHVASRDGNRVSTYLVAANTHSTRLNADRIVSLMQQDGFALERETLTDELPPGRRPARATEGVALFFRGRDREGLAVVSRAGTGKTSIVLNTVSLIRTYP